MAKKLKDTLFTPEKVQQFGKIILEVFSEFQLNEFVSTVCDKNWPVRELKEKMRHTTLSLHKFLPADYHKAVEILIAIVPKVNGFEAIVLPDYIEVYGKKHWDISLPALGELTKCGSSEFGIRPFLNIDLEASMKYMLSWADDDDFRVRRFASEGCRPRLPWAQGVPAIKKILKVDYPVAEPRGITPTLFQPKS